MQDSAFYPNTILLFYSQGLTEGLGTLMQSSAAFFPLQMMPLVDMCAALAKASRESMQLVRVL